MVSTFIESLKTIAFMEFFKMLELKKVAATKRQCYSGAAESNLEWGDPSSKAEGAIHLGGSERIGPGKF